MAWEPLNEVYFVRAEEPPAHPLIPDQFKHNVSNTRTAIVVHVGTGTLVESGKRIPLQASQGDRVLFGSKVGEELKVNGEALLILAEANVLAVERLSVKRSE